ncbi:hypothetical protein [Streptomyces sp. NPDC088812]|uniref:hypothetical protein n=1 Tax=Streptomyces sp. NPDC088812 TaxID=3365905 RepID=UPI00380FB474
MLYADDDNGIGGPLVLDPAMWQRELCRVIAYRTLTAAEQDRFPVHVSAQAVCPGR